VVEYRLDNGDWKPMTYTREADPRYVAALYRWDASEKLMPGRRPSNPVKSTHLWSVAFPNTKVEGTHTIEVRAKDMFGRTFTQTKTFRVEKP